MNRPTRLLLCMAFCLVACDARVVVPTGEQPTPPISPTPMNTVDGDSVPSPGVVPSPTPTDPAVSCAPPLSWRFVSDAEPPLDTDVENTFEVVGQVAYLGPIREPLPGAQGLTREVELIDDYSGQRLLLLQYALPQGVELPIRELGGYAFSIKRTWQWEGWAEALLIAKLERSLWPVIFVGEPAMIGQALELRDPLLGPVRIDLQPGPTCPLGDEICGEGATRSSLRFEFSTGAGIAETVLAPGEQGTLPIFGIDFTVTNLASHQIETPCADEPNFRASYTIVGPPDAG